MKSVRQSSKSASQDKLDPAAQDDQSRAERFVAQLIQAPGGMSQHARLDAVDAFGRAGAKHALQQRERWPDAARARRAIEQRAQIAVRLEHLVDRHRGKQLALHRGVARSARCHGGLKDDAQTTPATLESNAHPQTLAQFSPWMDGVDGETRGRRSRHGGLAGLHERRGEFSTDRHVM